MENDSRGIVVVDDEPQVRSMIATVLSESGFTNVWTAENGLECIKILAEKGESVYLVIIDEVMDKMSGIETIEYLTKVHPYIVGFIMISGHIGLEEFKRRTQNIDSSQSILMDFLAKPFDLGSIIGETTRSMQLIETKRERQAGYRLESMEGRLADISEKISRLNGLVERTVSNEKWLGKLLGNIGNDVIVAVILGLLVMVSLYFGLDDLLRSLITDIKR